MNFVSVTKCIKVYFYMNFVSVRKYIKVYFT